ncbi:MAG: hypothetical protein OEU98_03330 [Actinomycetota bacterium]|nr:hypothetical protein [Actinomycetota bacterium]
MRRTVVALGAGVLVLAGCSSTSSGDSVLVESGQAAVSDVFRVSQQEIADDVGLVLVGLGQPPGEPPAGLASATTERVVLYRLIDSFAEANGVDVTRTEVEEGLEELAAANGGQDGLREAALSAGIPEEALERTIRTNLLVTGIGSGINPSGDIPAQLESARVALSEYSESIDVAVAPRYGTWDDQTLAIIPGSSLTEPSGQEQATP